MSRLTLYTCLVLGFGVQNARAQAMEKSFTGWWAMTSWTFQFHGDGTYERKSKGHYGQTLVSGTYMLKGDTLTMLSGFENTNGTVNKTYLLDKDSMLIDLNLKYDYTPADSKGASIYSSKKRE